jgi:hypothetical protein
MAHTTLVRAAVQTLLGVVLVSGLGAVPTASATAPPTTTTAPWAGDAPARAHALDPGLALTGPDAPVVVTGGAGVPDAVREVGGRVLADLPLVDGVSAVVPADRLRSLADADDVDAVTADRQGRFVDFVWDDVPTASTFTRTVQADAELDARHLRQGRRRRGARHRRLADARPRRPARARPGPVR